MSEQEPFLFDGVMDSFPLPDSRVTTQQFVTAMTPVLSIAAQIFAESLEDDALWQARARIHGRFRTWWLRWRLRHRLFI